MYKFGGVWCGVNGKYRDDPACRREAVVWLWALLTKCRLFGPIPSFIRPAGRSPIACYRVQSVGTCAVYLITTGSIIYQLQEQHPT